MIFLLLDMYLLVLWLIFFRFKLLPFSLPAKIASGVIGILFVFGILIVVNFLHPMTMDARVFEHVVSVAPRIPQPGRVIEVPAQSNVPLKEGDVLFRIDPRPYEYEVQRLSAALAEAEQRVPQLKQALTAAKESSGNAKSQRDLAKVEADRNKELRKSEAVSQEDLDKSLRTLAVAEGSLREAEALVEKARLEYEAKTLEGVNVNVAQIQAQLSTAKLNLEESTVRAPADGFVTQLTLKPGTVVTPGQPVMSFVYNPEGIVVATLPQEYLGNIAENDEVEIALDMYPGEMLRGKVVTVLWASGEGQTAPTGTLRTVTQSDPRARFGVRIQMDEDVLKTHRLPAGAGGAAAIYTTHGRSFTIVRKVMVRWYTWLNYIKLAM
jgi:multidrug resistance efflux pump